MSLELDLDRVHKNLKKGMQKSVISAVVYPLNKLGLLDKFSDHVKDTLPRVTKIHGLTKEFKSRFVDLLAEGYLIEGYFGHFTHLDHPVLSEGLNTLVGLAKEAGYSDKLKRFALTLASSVRGGQQSPLMGAMYSKMKSYVDARNVDWIEITRADKDVDRYNMKPKVSERRELISRIRQRNFGIVIPAGDSVEPGRHSKGAIKDDIKGLQKIEGTDLMDLYTVMEKYGPTVFQPISVARTWLYFNSDNLTVTPEALSAVYYSRKLLGINLAEIINQQGIDHAIDIDITFGMPITPEDMVNNLGSNWRKDPEGVNLFLMTEQASLLPEYARGYYAPFVQNKLAAVQAIELSSRS